MNRKDAEQMVEELLLEHAPDHVIYQGWKFGGFTRAKKTLGLCVYSHREIRLSGEFVDLNDEERVRQTVLHEVAHVLAGPAAKHGPVWLTTARRIGYKGERTSSASMPSQGTALWLGTCTEGCKAKYHRKPGWKMLSYGICKKHRLSLTWTNTRTGEIANA